MDFNKMLVVSLVIAWPAFAAEGVPDAAVSGGTKPPQGELATKREQMCAQNPEKCKEMKAKMEQRREACKADPEKCRQENQARAAEHFKETDADGNGTLSRAEAEKGMPRLARHFDQLDANKDGQLSQQELEAARKAHQGAKRPGKS